MLQIGSVLVFGFVAAGVAAASIGESLWAIGLLAFGICVIGIKRKFDWRAVIEEGGIENPVSDLANSEPNADSHSSHDSGASSDSGSSDASDY